MPEIAEEDAVGEVGERRRSRRDRGVHRRFAAAAAVSSSMRAASLLATGAMLRSSNIFFVSATAEIAFGQPE